MMAAMRVGDVEELITADDEIFDEGGLWQGREARDPLTVLMGRLTELSQEHCLACPFSLSPYHQQPCNIL